MRHKIFHDLSAPLHIQWEITPNCNYNCVHCYNYWRDKTHLTLYADKINKSMCDKVVRELKACKVDSVVITGGEPLLVINEYIPYLRLLKKAGIELSLNSNLSLATPDVMRKIKTVGITGVLVSLHSYNPRTNDMIVQSKRSLERTSSGIKTAIAAGIEPSVNMVISKINLHDIFKTAEYVKKLGVKVFNASKAAQPLNCPNFEAYSVNKNDVIYIINELVRVKEELKMQVDSLIVMPDCFPSREILREICQTERHCAAGKTVAIIGYDGSIRACLHMSNNYGNIRNGLKKAWSAMSSDWRTDKNLPAKCVPCSVKEICGGGCKAEALTHGKKLSSTDPLADYSNIKKEQFKPLSKNNVAYNTNTIYVVNPISRFRKENFGGIVMAYSNFTSAQHPLFSMLKDKQSNEHKISLTDIQNVLKCSKQDAEDTFVYLLTKSIIVIYNTIYGKRN